MSKHALYPFYKPYDAPKGKRVYVSGPMTGIGDNNGPAFDAAAETLRLMGYAVCNPNETDQILGPLTFARYMRFDFQRVLEADFLIALPLWERSRGALAEILVAIRIDTPVWGWENWDQYDRIREPRVNAAISDLYSGRTISVAKEAALRAGVEAVDEERIRDYESEGGSVGSDVDVLVFGSPATSDGTVDGLVRQSSERVGVQWDC